MMARHRQVSRVQLEKCDVLGTHPRKFFAFLLCLSSAMRVERLDCFCWHDLARGRRGLLEAGLGELHRPSAAAPQDFDVRGRPMGARMAHEERDRRLGAVSRHRHELEDRAGSFVSLVHGRDLGRRERAREVGHGFVASEREPSTAENLEMHRGRRAVLKQHIDHLLHNGFGVHIDGTRRRLARHRHGRMIRKGTERIGKGFEVGVMGGEHGDEKQSDGAGAHAKCLRVRQTCETRKSELRANEWIVSFFID
jgi:hypothetical protein